MTNEAVLQAVYTDKKPIKTRSAIAITFEVPNDDYHDKLLSEVLGAPMSETSKWVTIVRMVDKFPPIITGDKNMRGIAKEVGVDLDGEPKHEHGDYARKLYRQNFFKHPDVWKACGTDAEFLDWIRRQPSCIDKSEAMIEACHVRRVKWGAGTGIKPPYCAIPMSHDQHHIQTVNGELACLKKYLPRKEWTEESAKEQFEDWRWYYLTEFCKETIKSETHYSGKSLAEIPPAAIIKWGAGHNLTQFLPSEG